MEKKRGFTLIELMIVVAIIGILASVAIPSFLKFINQSKKTESPMNMRAIANGAVAWYNDEHSDSSGNPMAKHFPHGSSPAGYPPLSPSEYNVITPGLPCGAFSVGAIFVKNTALWNSQPWLSLKFSVTKAHYFAYIFNTNDIGTSARFTVGSGTDLDCDSTYESFEMNGAIDAQSQEVELTEIRQITGSGFEVH